MATKESAAATASSARRKGSRERGRPPITSWSAIEARICARTWRLPNDSPTDAVSSSDQRETESDWKSVRPVASVTSSSTSSFAGRPRVNADGSRSLSVIAECSTLSNAAGSYSAA